MPLPAFYTEAVEVQIDGVLVHGDVLVLNQKISSSWKPITNRDYVPPEQRKKKTKISKYEDPALNSGQCSVDFEMIQWAAAVKRQLFPPQRERTEAWRDSRYVDFDKIPGELKNNLLVHRERDSILKELGPVISSTVTKRKEREIPTKTGDVSSSGIVVTNR